jgi:cyclopropane-fatty-acyl-phospholipid synthase
MMSAIQLAERGWLPDWLIRLGIRRLLAARLRQERGRDKAESARAQRVLLETLRRSPLAVDTRTANEQHYEVPAKFFELVLGPRLKYSCGHFSGPDTTLSQAEEQMLQLTCERAGIADGMDILELGCGWGSLTIWMAEKFPRAQVVAVSNSHSQRAFIESRCKRLGLANVQLITADVREFVLERRFDRVMSVEMFEHMRNYEQLLERISNWLHEDGRLFVHIFCHRELAYLFEDNGREDWMSRHFFTGGTMPSFGLLGDFREHMAIERTWRVSGLHYARTCELWLDNLDAFYERLETLFASQPQRTGADSRQLNRWRIFFMACAELFRWNGGEEWFVGHYLMQKIGRPSAVRSTMRSGQSVS